MGALRANYVNEKVTWMLCGSIDVYVDVFYFVGIHALVEVNRRWLNMVPSGYKYLHSQSEAYKQQVRYYSI